MFIRCFNLILQTQIQHKGPLKHFLNIFLIYFYLCSVLKDLQHQKEPLGSKLGASDGYTILIINMNKVGRRISASLLKQE